MTGTKRPFAPVFAGEHERHHLTDQDHAAGMRALAEHGINPEHVRTIRAAVGGPYLGMMIWFEGRLELTQREVLALALPPVPDESSPHAALNRIQALHRKMPDPDIPGRSWCFECGFTYPCPTIQAMETP